MEAFVELVLAPTNRAKCAACKRCPVKLHSIDKGELVLKSNYVPAGRNHFQSSSTSLSCITQKRMRNMLGDTGSISTLQGFEILPSAAQEAAMQLADCILANAPIDDSLKMARFPVDKSVETIAVPADALHIFGDPADAR